MDIKLKCSCGAVEGVAADITPENGSRVVCCCKDCQSFASYLDREDDVLDEFGGTEVFQTTQSQVQISKGSEHLRSVRLTSKGLIRWYADCCNTPIGNTMNAHSPFIALVHNIMHVSDDRSSALGPVRAYMQTKYARGTPTYPSSSNGFPITAILRTVGKMIVAKIKGLNKPSVFFRDGKAIVKPHIVSE